MLRRLIFIIKYLYDLAMIWPQISKILVADQWLFAIIKSIQILSQIYRKNKKFGVFNVIRSPAWIFSNFFRQFFSPNKFLGFKFWLIKRRQNLFFTFYIHLIIDGYLSIWRTVFVFLDRTGHRVLFANHVGVFFFF